MTADPTWATVLEAGASGLGDPAGTVWQSAECDAPLRDHDWFWHPGGEARIVSVEDLLAMYYASVGHKRIERIDLVEVSRVRLRVTKAIASPVIRKLAAYPVEKSPAKFGDCRWPLDEAEGDALRDALCGPDGRNRGTQRAQGVSGRALRFDGKGAHASLGAMEVHSKDFTFAARIQPEGSGAAESIIWSKERSGQGSSQMRLTLGPRGNLGFLLSGSGGGIWVRSPEGAVPPDRWSRVAVVRKGEDFRLVVDGKPVAQKSSEAIILHRNSLEMRLGARYAPSGDGPDSPFKGLIDDVRLWAKGPRKNKVRTSRLRFAADWSANDRANPQA